MILRIPTKGNSLYAGSICPQVEDMGRRPSATPFATRATLSFTKQSVVTNQKAYKVWGRISWRNGQRPSASLNPIYWRSEEVMAPSPHHFGNVTRTVKFGPPETAITWLSGKVIWAPQPWKWPT